MNAPKDAMNLPKGALTSEEAAHYLSISTVLLARMTKAGDIPHVRFGRIIRYSVAALERFLEQRSTTEWQDFNPTRRKAPKE
jgi:excisionase family DNA binding protein